MNTEHAKAILLKCGFCQAQTLHIAKRIREFHDKTEVLFACSMCAAESTRVKDKPHRKVKS